MYSEFIKQKQSFENKQAPKIIIKGKNRVSKDRVKKIQTISIFFFFVLCCRSGA
jgi:glutaredoxin